MRICERIDGFSGTIIEKNVLRVDLKKVKVLKSWPNSSTLADVRSFLGLMEFFRRFIKNTLEIAPPLTNLTKNDRDIQKWNYECDQAFESLKKAVKSARILLRQTGRKSSEDTLIRPSLL